MSLEEWVEIINRCDPVFLIAGGAPADEYHSEIQEIIDKSIECRSVEELAEVIREVFFAIPLKHVSNDEYLSTANEIWQRLQSESAGE